MELILAIIGTAITIMSLVYAVISNRRYKKLEDYNREESWEILRQANNVLALIQDLSRLEIDNSNFIKSSSHGERAAQELTVSCIRLIKRHEKVFDNKVIEEWYKQGKIKNESFVNMFKQFI